MLSTRERGSIIKLFEISHTHHTHTHTHTVPEPLVTLSAPVSEVFLAGTTLQLECSVQLDNLGAVDTAVSLSTTWDRSGVELMDGDRITIAQTQIDPYEYQSILTFSTVSSTMDNGNYTCTATVSPTDNEQYVASSTRGDFHSISVTGKHGVFVYELEHYSMHLLVL